MDYIFMFVLKLIDQLLRTHYLIEVKNDKSASATIIIGIQQIVAIYITVAIVTDFSPGNIFSLVSSTMLGTWLTMNKESFVKMSKLLLKKE